MRDWEKGVLCCASIRSSTRLYGRSPDDLFTRLVPVRQPSLDSTEKDYSPECPNGDPGLVFKDQSAPRSVSSTPPRVSRAPKSENLHSMRSSSFTVVT